MKERSAHQILKAALKRKGQRGHGYSMRALARDLKVSPAFVTNLLQGKRPIPKDRISKLIKFLELDTIEQKELSRAVLLSKMGTPALRSLLKKDLKTETLKRKTVVDIKQDDLLSDWWTLPVLESLSLDTGETFEEIQKRLGLTKAQWNKAIYTLIKEGVIEEVDGGYRKKEDHLYLSTGRSKAITRAFHKQMIEKALTEFTKTQDEDFQRRLITGYTFALANGQVEELKVMIMRFLDKASRQASDGECADIYQFNVQFFPLTKSRSTVKV